MSIRSNSGISKSSVQGDWFSPIQAYTPGAFTYQLRLHSNGEFQLFKILLHPDMRWEEARYRGRWKV
ncbi:MAG: hypothetical protein JJT78_06445, partial [Leptospira sp.]|nr:hypothetical protein [Leptospira sp.]